MDNKTKYGERSDSEVLHAFTKYIRIAMKGARMDYIAKRYKEDIPTISVEELVSRESPALAVEDRELELVLDNMESLEQVICNDTLLVAVLRLSDRERRIMNLHLVHKLKHREIADLLGVTKNTVELAYARSIKKLREYLKEDWNAKL